MKKISLSLILLFFLIQAGTGQSMKAFLEAAEEAQEEGNHYAALKYYDEALSFDTSRIDILYKSAEAARNFHAYSSAVKKYQKVVDQEQNGEYPLATFWLALMQQRIGMYEEATLNYGLYISEYGEDDEYYTSRARKEMAAAQWAIEGAPSPFREVTVEHLDASINSPYSEFGAISLEDKMYYTSLRFTKENDDRYPKRLVSKILEREGEGTTGMPIEGDLNSDDFHTAYTTFSLDGKRMYYNICHYYKDDSILCQIYYRPIDEEGNFGDSVKLPDFINLDSVTNTQPHISHDPFLDKEVLYFVSDRPGGKGKKDIYYSVIDTSGNFSNPINLETINTPEDEMAPFFHADSKMLYFSSEGYTGYGGLDIYRARKMESSWGKIENLGQPINSSFHDVYYVLEKDRKTAHYSSNRIGSFYLDNEHEACCFDIYKANITPCNLVLKTLVYDAITGEPIYSTSVVLRNLSDEEEEELMAGIDGNDFEKELECNKEYRIHASQFGYYPDSIAFSTADIDEGIDTLVKKIYLFPSHLDLEVLTFNKITLEALEGVTVRIVNLTDSNVPDLVLTNPDSNNFNFMVERGKQYRIVASKENFSPVSLDFETPEDRENNEKIIKKLYLAPAGFLKYLPLYIYYDNDKPNSKSWNKTTDKLYTETFDPYYAKKDTFKTVYVDTLSGEEKRLAEEAIDDFFENKLKKGYDEYLKVLEDLEVLLNQGMDFEIVVKGYASPRASSAYNKRLGERRYNAVKNEIEGYREGVLIKYIRSGNLKIRYISYGDQTAPSHVSGDLDDERNSIYSPEASKERRVEVIEVKKIGN